MSPETPRIHRKPAQSACWLTGLWLILAGAASGAAPEADLGPGFVNPGYEEKPGWFKTSFLDLNEDVAEARAAGKRVMLYFYQDGCPYCARLLRVNFSTRSIVDKTRKHFDVIAINMWGDREVTDLDGQQLTEKQFAEKWKVMFTPTILILDPRGKVALRINGYYPPDKFEAALDYTAQGLEKKLAFRDYYAQRNPVKATGKLHDESWILKPPYDLSRLVKADKPLLILFEQAVCRTCDEYHRDIYQRPATRRLLARFSIVRLDIWSDMPLIDLQGRQTTARQLARAMNVKFTPTMVFVDRNGREVFRTEAYLRAFHLQSSLDYVASGAYRKQPNFQRYIAARADRLEAQGVHVDLWK